MEVPRGDLPFTKDAQGEAVNAGVRGDGPAANRDENVGSAAVKADGGANRKNDRAPTGAYMCVNRYLGI
jgi:hypothetical protein